MTDAGNDWWWALDNVGVELPSDDGDLVPGITDSSAWTFETSHEDCHPQTEQPQVAVNTNLEVTFDASTSSSHRALETSKSVAAADDSVFEVIPVASDRVVANGQTVTIDPVNDLEARYRVLRSDRRFRDL